MFMISTDILVIVICIYVHDIYRYNHKILINLFFKNYINILFFF